MTLNMEKDFDRWNENKNEIATFSSGDFGSSYEGPTSRNRIVTPRASIANRSVVSTARIGIVDNSAKPSEGIEPSESRVTILLLHPADGVRSVYHTIRSFINTKPPNEWAVLFLLYTTWRIVARESMPRRLWCRVGLAITTFHLHFKRIPCSDRTILRGQLMATTTTDLI